MEEQTIKVWGRDLKTNRAYGNLYVCGERTGGLWYTVLKVESDPRGNTYICVDPGVRFNLYDETKKTKKPWKVKKSFIKGQRNREAQATTQVKPTPELATQKGETK